MVRPPSIQYSGAYYRVTDRGSRRVDIFLTDKSLLADEDEYRMLLGRDIHLNPIPTRWLKNSVSFNNVKRTKARGLDNPLS
jgi:hypothetical protein